MPQNKQYFIGGLICLALIGLMITVPKTAGTAKYPLDQKSIYSRLKQRLSPETGAGLSRTRQIDGRLLALSMILMLYTALVLTGVAVLMWFIFKKTVGRPAIERIPPPGAPEPPESGELFFYLPFFILLVYAALWYLKITAPAQNLLPAQALVMNMTAEIGIIAVILHSLKAKAVGMDRKISWMATAQIYTATLPLLLLVSIISSRLPGDKNAMLSTSLILTLHGIPLWLLMAQVIFFAPAAEELLFRGFIFRRLRRKYSFFPAATITSLAFSLLHLEASFIPALFVISFALCYLYEKTRNILNPVLMHAAINCLNASLILAARGIIQF